MARVRFLVVLALVALAACGAPAQQKRRGSLGMLSGPFVPPTRITGGGNGDITAVNTTAPLAGGVTAGAATISISPCDAGEVLKYTGAAWDCAADDGGSGDITEVTVSAPITGGGGSGSVPIGLGLCAANQLLKMDGSGASWLCASDDGGTGDIEGISAGDGLFGGGSSGTPILHVLPGSGMAITADAVTLDMPTTTCSSGQFVASNTATGTLSCAAELGDVSAVTVSAPITGGGTSGSVPIGLGLCASNQILKMDAGGSQWVCAADGGGGISGSGTTGTISKWSSSTGLTDSLITESGTTVDVGGHLTINNSATISGSLIAQSGATFSTTVQINGVMSTQSAVNLGNSAGDTVTVADALVVNGNTTIGNSGADAHQVLGSLTTFGNITGGGDLTIPNNAELGNATSDSVELNGAITTNILHAAGTPSVSCGSGASMDANSTNSAGVIHGGDSAASSGCTITFAGGGFSTGSVVCVATSSDTTQPAAVVGASLTQFIVKFGPGDDAYYMCKSTVFR